jgi:hypothetical protein
MDITEKILEQIAHHRAEILRLESALDVIAQVSGKPVKKDAPLITIRRTVPTEASDPPPVQKKRKSPSPSARKTRSMQLSDNRRARTLVLTALKNIGPALTRDLVAPVGFKPGQDIQPLYQRLYELKRDGLAVKDEEGRYVVTAAGLAALEGLVQEADGDAGASEQAA